MYNKIRIIKIKIKSCNKILFLYLLIQQPLFNLNSIPIKLSKTLTQQTFALFKIQKLK